ncbi:TonB-dependent receptor [Flavisolibacter sp. BT320]|nr:TonB-dependent receptor [Flavisolibacter longurius]
MRLFFLFLLLAGFTTLQAQTISGFVKDDAGAALSGATVALVKAKDTAVVKLAVAGGNGGYVFQDIGQGEYRIMVSHVGHDQALSTPFSVGSTNVTAPALTVKKVSGDMAAITVSARKPMIEVRADKTVLNVEGTINAAGSDALELLRKSPGVTVDKDENLSVNGKNGVQIYIDGRPSPLSGSDLANFLKSTQSSQVESIEIITNPSARFEAAGNAGIINIRMKKNRAYGTNGSVNAGYAVGTFSRYNAGLSLNHRNKNINLYGTYSYATGPTNNNMEFYRTVLDTAFNQKGRMIYDNLSHNVRVGADYTLDKKSSIGVLFNANYSDPKMTNTNSTPISYVPTGVVDRILVADNSSNLKRNSYNINLNYNFLGTDGKSLMLNADKGYFKNNNDQYQPNYYFAPNGTTFLRSVIVQMIAPTNIDIYSGKIDYEQNFKGGKLGLGGKVSFVKTDNDFRRFDVTSSGNVFDRERSNRFVYDENINAVYVNWNKAYKGLMVQGGLRVENTIAKGKSTGERKDGSGYVPMQSGFDRNYTNFFPSAAVTFNKNPMDQWSVSYSRRIDRPAYQNLNPFEFKLDEYSVMKGNINLRPQFTNSFELTNIRKYRLTTKLGYSHISDLFTQIIDTADGSKSVMMSRNLATQDIVSLNVSYPLQYKAYSLFANLNANYSMNRANFGNGRIIDVNAFGATLYAQNSIRFAKTWTAELSGVYIAPTVFQGTFKSKGFGFMDIGLQKQIFGGNGTVKVSASDILHTFKIRATSDFAGQVTRVNIQPEMRQFKINFSWRFGSTTVKAAKQRSTAAEEEAKRAQQSGGSGINIGQ